MVYALQKFRHYLLASHFKMFTDHSTLKYLENKLVLGGKICRWLLLFQEYDFEVIIEPGRLNAGPNHLSRLESSEEPISLEECLPDLGWHDRHIKSKEIKEGDLVLMYDNKFAWFPGKFHMHWMGPYQVKHVIEGGATSLAKLDGTMLPTMVNGSRLKLYRDSQPPFST